MLIVSILSVSLLFCPYMQAMEGSERALLPAGAVSSSKTPEDMLNEAAAQWFEERDSLLAWEKAANCCAKTVGVGCTAAGAGVFSYSAFIFAYTTYNDRGPDRFLGQVLSGMVATGGVILTGAGAFFLYPRKYLAKTLKDLDVRYIDGVFRILTMKSRLNEDELAPEAKELLTLTRKNPFSRETEK